MGLPGNVSNVNLIGGFNPYIHQIGNHFSPSLVGVNITKKKYLKFTTIDSYDESFQQQIQVPPQWSRACMHDPTNDHRFVCIASQRRKNFTIRNATASCLVDFFFGLGLAGNAGYGVMMLLYKDKCEICEIRVVTTLPIHFPPNVSQSLFSCGKS